MRTWIAQPPIVEGTVGTGPVDLSIATGVLTGPPGFDMPGGAGNILLRAQGWFAEQANSASSEAERYENVVGMVRAINNLGVWCMTRYDAPDKGIQAHTWLSRAEAIARKQLVGTEILGGILFNLGELLREAGHPDQSAALLAEAASLGVR